jgi:transposase
MECEQRVLKHGVSLCVFLAVQISNVAIKFSLQFLDVFSFLWSAMRRSRTEERLGTQCAATFDGNILQPFGHAQYWFLHRSFAWNEANSEVRARSHARSERDLLSPVCTPCRKVGEVRHQWKRAIGSCDRNNGLVRVREKHIVGAVLRPISLLGYRQDASFAVVRTLRCMPGFYRHSITVVNRWDEKAGLRRDAVRSQVIDVLEAQEIRRPAMKKVSTVAVKESRNISQPKLTIGLDLGDRNSWYCMVDEAGQIRLEQRVRTNAKALQEVFGAMPRRRIALETGTHSPWISRLLHGLGHEVIVANARRVRLIGESRKKDDRLDAQTLARLARIDPKLLSPVKHRSAQAQADLTVIRARAGLVWSRTALVNTVRGLAKSYGERLRGCNVRNMNPEKAEGLSPELQAALQPLLVALESLSEQIAEYNEGIEKLAQESYPQVALLKQIKGVGTLIALTFLLTLEDPHRFRKSRDVGCYLGLQPGRRNSGQSEPQMHVSKEGDSYLRTLLVQGAQHILGPFGIDCDLRRWGLKLAERGGRSGKKRAIVATARKLAVLLHHLWVSGEVYGPLHNSQRRPLTIAA